MFHNSSTLRHTNRYSRDIAHLRPASTRARSPMPVITTGSPEPTPDPGLLTRLPLLVRWLILLVISALFSAVLQLIHLPGSLLLGPMVAARLRHQRSPFARASGSSPTNAKASRRTRSRSGVGNL